ncbi:MAG: hypothetical protein AAB790_00370 [Patescibacteria group bacterium]
MDTSIRLKRIQDAFGNSPVKIGAMTPKQAEVMALEVLGASVSSLQFLAGFIEFGDYLEDARMDDNGMARRDRDDKSRTYDLPAGYNGSSFCIPFRRSAFKRLGQPRSRRSRKQGCVYRQELLLTREGDILVWDWFARCERTERGLREIAIRSKVRLAKGRTVKKIFSNPFSAQSFLAKVGWLVTDTIENREKHLASMRGLDTFIRAVEGQLVVH